MLVFCHLALSLFAWDVGVYPHNSETYIASEWQKITYQDQQVEARIIVDKRDVKFELKKNLFAEDWEIETKVSVGTSHKFKAKHIEPNIITVIPEDSDRFLDDLLVGVLVVLRSDERASKKVDYGWQKINASDIRSVWR